VRRRGAEREQHADVRCVLGLLALAACGRVGFDALPGDVSPDGGGGGTTSSCPPALHGVVTKQSGSAAMLTVPITPGAGDLLVLGMVVYDDTTSVELVTDDAGDVYRSAGARATVPGDAVEIWYAAGVRGGATMVTVKLTSASGGALWASDVSGLRGDPPVIAMQGNVAGGSTLVAPEVITTGADSFVFSIAAISTGTLDNLHAGSAFSALPPQNGDDAAYLFAHAPGRYSAVWDATAFSNGCASTAAFAAAP